MPASMKQQTLMRILAVAMDRYRDVFQSAARKHRASDVRLHPQHAIIWPLMGLTDEGAPEVLDSDAHAGMCAGLSHLWIYYLNFFQDGIYAGAKSVHLFDVFNAEHLTKRVTRLAVQGGVDEKTNVAEVNVDRSDNATSASYGLGTSAARGMGLKITPEMTLDQRKAAFDGLRLQSTDFSLLSDALSFAHSYGNTKKGRSSEAENEARMAAEADRLLVRFGCENANRTKSVGRPWSGVGSHMKAGRFYTIGSGTHKMAASTMKQGVTFYDPNVGELKLPTTAIAAAFFRDYFTATYEATNAVKRENAEHRAIVGDVTDLATKKLKVVEYKSTRGAK